MNKRIVLDFDDTLAFTKNRDWANASPNKPLIEKCNALFDAGWQIDIYTARGSLSCKTRAEANTVYRQQITDWLKEHNVKYDILSFNKPFASYYIDDKGMTPELFLETDIQPLTGGLSGADLYTDGKPVHKSADNCFEVAEWYASVKGGVNIPKIERVVGNTLTMEYIPHDEDYFLNNPYRALAEIQDAIESLELLPPPDDLKFISYIDRIQEHADLSKVLEFKRISQALSSYELERTFTHGDFGIKNMLFANDKLFLIDPLPNVFGCLELDVAKFIASLIINEYPSHQVRLAFNTLIIYNSMRRELLTALVRAEIVRVYKYHPDKEFIIDCTRSVPC